jgi:hypothetical protein
MGQKQSSPNTGSIYISTEKELEQYMPYIQEELQKDADNLSKSADDIYFYHIDKNPITIVHPNAKTMPFWGKTLDLNPNVRGFAVSKFVKRPHIISPIYSRGFALHWVRGQF